MKIKYSFIIFILFLFGSCSFSGTGEEVKQIKINRIEEMPEQPQPYKMLNWKELAMNFDRVVFDSKAEGEFRPFIWKDNARRNINQETFGIYTAIGDVRQGPDHSNGEFHEALCSLGAVLGAGLVGIDKENQNGLNYVKMLQNYFNSDNGWDIIMNNTCSKVAGLGGGYGRDWWYDVFPNVLYYAVCDVFPGVDGADAIQHSVANKFYRADSILNGDYDYSYFDYATMEGKRNRIPFQQDAAAGHAYVLYSAYEKFGDKKYLQGAKSAIEAILNQGESRFYEVLMPFGAYVAARLNAEQGTNYNFTKILNWTFDGCKATDGRTGWGVIVGEWGKYDVSGLLGSITDNGGYGFLMNTFTLAWPLIPLVRYDARYAEAIGKWMLNAANAARLCYPYEIADENQWLPKEKAITRNVIAYEGIRKRDTYGKKCLKGSSPVALGDGPQWAKGQPVESMFSIYGSAYVGLWGAIIRKTNVDKILQLNCLATDFYHTKAYPTYLYFNPYDETKTVDFNTQGEPVDLYDIVKGKIVARNIEKKGYFKIAANQAAVIVTIPTGVKIVRTNGKVMAKGIIIAFK